MISQVIKEKLSLILGSFVLYWSLPLAVVFGEWFHTRKNRNDLIGWSSFLCRFFKVRFYRVGEQECYKKSPCIWLCNHRDWADFFIDLYVSEGRAAFLSRMMVLIAFPVFGIYAYLSKTAIFFKRNSKGRDFSKFNKMMTDQLQRCPFHGIAVYPEGTRNIRPESLPLKRGMLRYCYSERTPVQIIITTNKEHILSQKMLKATFGVKCMVGYSPPIDPSDYSDFQLFYDDVQKHWEEVWERTYKADIRDSVEITRSHIKISTPLYNVPPIQYLLTTLYSFFTVVLMISVITMALLSFQNAVGLSFAPFGNYTHDCLFLWTIIALSAVCTKIMMRKED